MLHLKPILKYNGLTIILSNPSRFDHANERFPSQGRDILLSANGGQMFNDHCLRPEYNSMQCDIRLADDESPLLENTKCILALGEYAMHKVCPSTVNNTLNEMRGSPLTSKFNIPTIASFFPQDAVDFKAHEQRLNTESKEYVEEGSEDSEDEDEGDSKTFSRTKRANYAFWLRRDSWKCKQIIKGDIQHRMGKQPAYRIYPGSQEVINILTKTKNEYLYFDIETDYEEQNLLCFAFSFDGSTVYSVPVLDYNYHVAYSATHHILRALAIAFRDNTVVAHNGAAFDFFVLAAKYHIPVYKCYDTMLAMHRCFPDIEKSLGHCVSYWTWEKFHKNSDSRAYRTKEHMMDKLLYCAKDVYTMFLVHKAIDEYAKTIPGLEQSITCANDSIRPYLITTLQGIRYDENKVEEKKKENDRLMMQYIRIIRLLMGESAHLQCRAAVKGKAKAFPGSNTQCCNYFHTQLEYPIQFHSPKTGKPSLGKKIMFKLALKYPDNPVITFTLLYRQIAKEYGTLKFNPFKDNDNKITKEPTLSKQEKILQSGQSLLRSVQAFID